MWHLFYDRMRRLELLFSAEMLKIDLASNVCCSLPTCSYGRKMLTCLCDEYYLVCLLPWRQMLPDHMLGSQLVLSNLSMR